MERNSLSSTNHSIVMARTAIVAELNGKKAQSNDRVLKASRNKLCNRESYEVEEDYNNSNNKGFSWPPRSYTCSFCKREFRSAQALGGHMNVHRRDRARLRQYSPSNGQYSSFINLNLKSNPNPNFQTSGSDMPTNSTFSNTLPSLISSTPHSSLSSPFVASSTEIKRFGTLFDPADQTIVSADNLAKIKNHEKRFIDQVGKFDGYSRDDGWKVLKKDELDTKFKEELDLELRLGFRSN